MKEQFRKPAGHFQLPLRHDSEDLGNDKSIYLGVNTGLHKRMHVRRLGEFDSKGAYRSAKHRMAEVSSNVNLQGRVHVCAIISNLRDTGSVEDYWRQ